MSSRRHTCRRIRRVTGPERQELKTARERIAARRRARRNARLAGWLVIPPAMGRWPWRTIGIIAAGGTLLIALVAVWSALFGQMNDTLDAIRQDDPRLRVTPSPPPAPSVVPPGVTPPPVTITATPGEQAAVSRFPNAPFTVLLLGVDKRSPDESVRSDTLIVVYVDPSARFVSMLSIPRDSAVEIPPIGQTKINSAYGYGYANAATLYGADTSPDAAGGAYAAETVERFLGVRIDYIAQVDFMGFERLVDSVGGITIDAQAPVFDAEFPTEQYGVERIYIAPGLQTLDGRMALVYARTRHASSDFDRSLRQQQVLRALFAHVRQRGIFANVALLPRWLEVLAGNVRTTLPIDDLRAMGELARFSGDLSTERIQQLSVNPADVAVDREDGSTIVWNRADLTRLIARWRDPVAWLTRTTSVPGPEEQEPSATALPATALPAWQAPPRGAERVAFVVVPPDSEQARVQVLNAAAINGVAGRMTTFLRQQRFTCVDPETLSSTATRTLIYDFGDHPMTRQRLAEVLELDDAQIITEIDDRAPPQGRGVDIVVVLGSDVRDAWLVP